MRSSISLIVAIIQVLRSNGPDANSQPVTSAVKSSRAGSDICGKSARRQIPAGRRWSVTWCALCSARCFRSRGHSTREESDEMSHALIQMPIQSESGFNTVLLYADWPNASVSSLAALVRILASAMGGQHELRRHQDRRRSHRGIGNLACAEVQQGSRYRGGRRQPGRICRR